MDFVAHFARDTAKNYAVPVATLVVVCALLEPVCQVIKNVWESKMLGLNQVKTTDEYFRKSTATYEEISQKPFLGDKTTWTDFFTKVGMIFNDYRPFAGLGLSQVAVPFLVGATVLNHSK